MYVSNDRTYKMCVVNTNESEMKIYNSTSNRLEISSLHF